MKIFKHKKAFYWFIPWAILGVISFANLWLFKKPTETLGLPLVAWIVIVLVLIIIIRSRR